MGPILSHKTMSHTLSGLKYMLIPSLQPVVLTPLLWVFWFKYAYSLPPAGYILASVFENTICIWLFLLGLRLSSPKSLQPTLRACSFILVALLIACHALITTTDCVALYLLGGPLNSELLYNIWSTIMMNKGTITEANSLAPKYFIISLLIELVVVFSRHFSIDYHSYSKLPTILPLTNTTTSDPSASFASSLKNICCKENLFRISLSLAFIVLIFCGNYAPVTNFLISSYEAIDINEDVVKFNGSLGKCDVAFEGLNFQLRPKTKQRPNLVYIMNESFGNHVFKTPEGQANSPFWRDVLTQDPNVFNFENARSSGGNTDSAAPAAFTGYILATELGDPKTSEYYRIPSLTCMAKLLGYKTALYSAYETHYDHGWKQLNGIFDQFDQVVSKTTLQAPSVNDLGMDDRDITQHILRFLEEQDPKGPPFYLMIIWNNNHAPTLVDEQFKEPEGASDDEIRFARASYTAKITDSMLSQVYGKLQEKGLLRNTVIGSLSDHGEGFPDRSLRASHLNSKYLSNPFWMHIPPYYLSSNQQSTLRNNQQRVVSNMDMVPTLVDILGWTKSENWFNITVLDGMIHGQSLTQPSSMDRIIPGWQGQPFVPRCSWNFGHLSNSTHNLLLKVVENDIVLERVDDYFHTHIEESHTWRELGEVEQQKWMKELEKYPSMLRVLRKCGLSII